MKKLLFIGLILLLLAGCRKHVFETYYGKIDTDTTAFIIGDDNEEFYLVNVEEMDSVTAKVMGLDGAYYVDFYSPVSNSYFRQLFGSDGGASDRIFYDPYDND